MEPRKCNQTQNLTQKNSDRCHGIEKTRRRSTCAWRYLSLFLSPSPDLSLPHTHERWPHTAPYSLTPSHFLSRTQTLDNMVPEGQYVLFAKIDSQGHDYKVLQGAGGLLSLTLLKYSILILPNYRCCRVLTDFSRRGGFWCSRLRFRRG